MNVTPSECNAAVGFVVSVCSWVSGHFNVIDGALSLAGVFLGVVLALISIVLQVARWRHDKEKRIREIEKHKQDTELHNLKMKITGSKSNVQDC